MLPTDNHLRDDQRPVWREPMVWLVGAIPAGSVLASVMLVVVAVRSGGADVVADPVQRTAQVQVADLGPDARAQQLRLSAIVRIGVAHDGQRVLEVLPIDGAFDRNAPLNLSLHHPSRAERDRTVSLIPSALGWRSGHDLDLGHDWNVQLAPADRTWRLQGRWPAGQQATHLRPALGEE